tara:strand:+ start:93 stop:410 length:318 start_codon:yes stop_codon:yes gene_type:complete
MEGVLEKYETNLFVASWKPYFFVLHEDILRIMDYPKKTQLLAQIHLKVSNIKRFPSQKAAKSPLNFLSNEAERKKGTVEQRPEFQVDCGGLFELRLKAPDEMKFR